MTQEESVLLGLQELLQASFNTILTKNNRKHNDGIIVEGITACYIEDKKGIVPYISFSTIDAVNKTKDRIIDSTVYRVELTFYVKQSFHDTWRIRSRYIEGLQELVSDTMVNEGRNMSI